MQTTGNVNMPLAASQQSSACVRHRNARCIARCDYAARRFAASTHGANSLSTLPSNVAQKALREFASRDRARVALTPTMRRCAWPTIRRKCRFKWSGCTGMKAIDRIVVA
jgi:hypothetical protein